MANRLEIVVMTGDLKDRRFEVGETAILLGRSSSNDIHVPDEELSRKHCIFERAEGDVLRLTDLASANGTYVNGHALGVDPVTLKLGDVIEVGTTVLRIEEKGSASAAAAKPAESAQAVDLGLGAPSAESASKAGPPDRPKRSALVNVLWAVAVLSALGAIGFLLLAPPEVPVAQVPKKAESPAVREVVYEKVKADAKGIFRYALSLADGGTLTVKVSDTTNNRHMAPKTKALSPEGFAELAQILDYATVSKLEESYAGVEPDPPALDSATLKVVYSSRVKTVSIVNTPEPDAFAAIREKLEAFSKSELGVWAIAYSRERLIELAEQAVRLGQSKWEDRDVNHGNLAASIAAFEEARFYLETVNPKPDCYQTASDGLVRAKTELDKRYTDQRFLADRALNLSQWETARDELRILLEMVPDRKDDRNRDARQKLVSAESNLKKKGGK